MSLDNAEDTCNGTTPPQASNPCEYFPEQIPLQQSIQNQERYQIVNQEYGGNVFS